MWQYFKKADFACKCGCGRNEIQEAFVFKLDDLRRSVGFPLIVTSGYRCPEHNRRVSSTGGSGPHTTGRAVDFRVDRERALRVVQEALEAGFTGIGIKQHGDGRFIHLDDLPGEPGRPRPTIWSYA